jgi:hypothetical protein
MGTAKIFEAGAFGLEYSRQATPHGGWGDNLSANKLESSAGFPWLSFSNQFNIGTAMDNSVTSTAFETGSRIVSKTVDNDLSFHNRFEGCNAFLAWMWGWEGAAVETVALTVTDASVPLVAGDVLTDLNTTDTFTFARYETYRDMEFNLLTLAILYPDAPDTVPTAGPGTLDGTVNDLPYLTTSLTMYEHLYELAKDGRQLRNFTADEETALGGHYVTDDQRCLMGTLAKRYTEFQVRYANALSKKMDIKWTPAELSTYDSGYMAFREERVETGNNFEGSTQPVDFDMACSLTDVTGVVAHYQTAVEIGKRNTDTETFPLAEEGITDLNISTEIPLQNLQDTISGVYLANPFLEGKYKITSSMTVSRMDGPKFSEYRDTLQKLKGRISSNMGFLMQEVLIKEFTLTKAGGDDSDVTAEPLDLSINASCGVHDFADHLYGQTEVNNSPIVMRTRDYNKYNMLLGRDASGTSI